MLSASSLHLFLVGLAAASPVTQSGSHSPAQSRSKGFTLVANVTDLGRELYPPVHGWVLTPLHDGGGTNFAGLGGSQPGKDTIFFENGTAAQIQAGEAHILFDGPTAPLQIPYGLSVGPKTVDGAVEAVRLDNGVGTVVGLAGPPDPYTYVTVAAGGTFVACHSYVAAGQSVYTTVGFVYASPGGKPSVPVGCVPLTLVPQCAKLPDLAPDPNPNVNIHQFAAEVACYNDVAGIHWD